MNWLLILIEWFYFNRLISNCSAFEQCCCCCCWTFSRCSDEISSVSRRLTHARTHLLYLDLLSTITIDWNCPSIVSSFAYRVSIPAFMSPLYNFSDFLLNELCWTIDAASNEIKINPIAVELIEILAFESAIGR